MDVIFPKKQRGVTPFLKHPSTTGIPLIGAGSKPRCPQCYRSTAGRSTGALPVTSDPLFNYEL